MAVKAYEKRDSFDSFRSKQVFDPSAIRERVKRIESGILRGEGSYFNKIVAAAIRDILDPSPSPAKFALSPHAFNEITRVSDEMLSRYLFYRYRYDVFPRTFQKDDFPPCIQVEVTSICNYRCVFCYQIDTSLTARDQGHMGMMPFPLFQRVIDEAEGKCEAVTLASRGEPLANNNLVKMLHYMKGKFLASKVNTNASLLTEEVAHGILESGLSILVFSCDAADEKLYRQLRVRGDLQTVLKNIRRFKDIKEKYYPDSRLITRVSGVKADPRQSMETMSSLWSELVDEIAFVNYNPWENTYAQPENNEERPCSDLWRRCFVWWDGLSVQAECR